MRYGRIVGAWVAESKMKGNWGEEWGTEENNGGAGRGVGKN
jgi:hypothetical protein